MGWGLLFGVVAVLGVALLVAALRRAELARMERSVRERERSIRLGGDGTQLQSPVVDLSRCLGCATCVAVCPEDGVLELVHGQAMVVRGARCKGISACERECPVGAITVTIANLDQREDVPVVTDELEAVGSPGLFLAGEVTAHSLIATAVDHGTAVGAEVARRVQGQPRGDVLDLCIVGAGPAGLACSLEARRHELDFVTLEQESSIGGTVVRYPRRKLVTTQPITLPLAGRLRPASYEKESLVELWQRIASEHELPIRSGEAFEDCERDGDGNYVVRTATGVYAARNVCLAIGRRGRPRRLGVPGEDLPKVSYALLDARSYRGRRILVVGGGDQAVEAALALAEQDGNRVTLSYRKEAFFRIRSANQRRVEAARAAGELDVLFRSEVRSIGPDSVELAVSNGKAGAGGAKVERRSLPNDDVFVMAGGTPALDLLERSGVSFDAALRPAARPAAEIGTGLVPALKAGFAFSLAALAWVVWHGDYYMLAADERPTHPKHVVLRPGMGIGLWLGIASCALIVLNLLYLVRRSSHRLLAPFRPGSLRLWMTSHVATGILALLCAMLHGGLTPGTTPGGHALWALVVLAMTGAIGRYLYAHVPRAANGRELELEEVKARLGRLSGEWDRGQRRFREHARDEVAALVEKKQWRSSFAGRLLALLGVRHDLRRCLARLAATGEREGIGRDEIEDTLRLARRAHRTALMAAHYEDLRALLGTWRYVHRWTAALMILLLVAHVVNALFYGSLFLGGGGR